jgi:hypothetical protein
MTDLAAAPLPLAAGAGAEFGKVRPSLSVKQPGI